MGAWSIEPRVAIHTAVSVYNAYYVSVGCIVCFRHLSGNAALDESRVEVDDPLLDSCTVLRLLYFPVRGGTRRRDDTRATVRNRCFIPPYRGIGCPLGLLQTNTNEMTAFNKTHRPLHCIHVCKFVQFSKSILSIGTVCFC
jgi:hypothetical protein